jgi:carbon storage regulator CsrA
MLVLSRREGEKILIPDLGISLEIVRVQGSSVKVGIEAPREVKILRAEVADRAAKTDGAPNSDKASTTADKPSRRALVVEDDRTQSMLLAGVLRASGYEVDVACDGKHALDYLAAHELPDVVLMDMIMPRLSGADAIEAIRNNPRYEGLKIIGVSGKTPREAGVAIGPAGADDWLPKPLNPERLLKELDRRLTHETGTA